MSSQMENIGNNDAEALRQRGFIAAIVEDAAHPPCLRTVRGYIGDSNEKGCIRVYLDIELRRFVDVPVRGIVYAQEIPETILPFGAVYLWVRDDVEIIHHGHWAATQDPTTMATGEEGGGDPTTMATGEEGTGTENPLDLVINPFGQF